MKLIIGLGNPGKEYEKTRHNVGFMVLDEIVRTRGLEWQAEQKFNALIAGGEGVFLAKPQSFMNESGDSVSKLANFYRIALDDLTVIHDDVDLEFGKTRLKKGMGSGGHHGVDSVIEKLGSKNFWRLKVGIGRPGPGIFDVESWVLQKLDDAQLREIVKRTNSVFN